MIFYIIIIKPMTAAQLTLDANKKTQEYTAVDRVLLTKLITDIPLVQQVTKAVIDLTIAKKLSEQQQLWKRIADRQVL